MSNQHNLKAGDSVVVKPGVKDPDTGANIGGWQGRISNISEGAKETTIGILWDSVTLKKMPRSMIEYCEDVYGLFVEVTKSRDSYDFPLCDLEATDRKSKNYQLLKDYVVWHANR